MAFRAPLPRGRRPVEADGVVVRGLNDMGAIRLRLSAPTPDTIQVEKTDYCYEAQVFEARAFREAIERALQNPVPHPWRRRMGRNLVGLKGKHVPRASAVPSNALMAKPRPRSYRRGSYQIEAYRSFFLRRWVVRAYARPGSKEGMLTTRRGDVPETKAAIRLSRLRWAYNQLIDDA